MSKSFRPVDDARGQRLTNIASVAVIMVMVVLFGATAYYHFGHGRWSFFDCLYMTVITVSTVGFGETLEGMHEVPEARIVTMLLIVLGAGFLLTFFTQLTALFVETDLRGILRLRRMEKAIEKLENHIVVCGAGSTGEHVIRELLQAEEDFVVIDTDPARVHVLMEDLGARFLFIEGDATDDHSLQAAGVERARGVIAVLHDDKDNVFVTVSVRALNRNATIIAKAIEVSAKSKLRRAGAHRVVSPNEIGGRRLVSEMIRPYAVEFLDRLLSVDRSLRIEDVMLPPESNLIGKRLRNAAIRRTGALVVAIRDLEGEYTYNPGPEQVLRAGDSLIVIARHADLERLREGIENNQLLA